MTITLTDMKKELIPKYIDLKSWAKWWSRKRTEIKKDPHFAFSDKKKDLIIMRDKPVTFTDELLEGFTAATGFSEKLRFRHGIREQHRPRGRGARGVLLHGLFFRAGKARHPDETAAVVLYTQEPYEIRRREEAQAGFGEGEDHRLS